MGRIERLNFFKSEFQSKRTCEERVRDSSTIKKQHPDKIAVIVERSKSERTLPILDKTKFLVPVHVTVTELFRVLRRRLQDLDIKKVADLLAVYNLWLNSELQSLKYLESRARYKLYPIIKLAPGQALFLFSSRGLPPDIGRTS